MNKQRRQTISKIIELLDDVKNKLEDVLNDEENYFDNMPENLQGGMRGMDSEEAIDTMNEAVECIDNAIEAAEEAVSCIEDI